MFKNKYVWLAGLAMVGITGLVIHTLNSGPTSLSSDINSSAEAKARSERYYDRGVVNEPQNEQAVLTYLELSLEHKLAREFPGVSVCHYGGCEHNAKCEAPAGGGTQETESEAEYICYLRNLENNESYVWGAYLVNQYSGKVKLTTSNIQTFGGQSIPPGYFERR